MTTTTNQTTACDPLFQSAFDQIFKVVSEAYSYGSSTPHILLGIEFDQNRVSKVCEVPVNTPEALRRVHLTIPHLLNEFVMVMHVLKIIEAPPSDINASEHSEARVAVAFILHGFDASM